MLRQQLKDSLSSPLRKKRKRQQDQIILDMDFLHSMVSDKRTIAFLKSEHTDPHTFPLNLDSSGNKSRSNKNSVNDLNADSEENIPICHYCNKEQTNKDYYVTCTNSNCKQTFCIDCMQILFIVSLFKYFM